MTEPFRVYSLKYLAERGQRSMEACSIFRIERSRTLIPELLKLSAQGTASEENILEFYDNLFTVKNLRLVHIVCHDKGSHK